MPIAQISVVHAILQYAELYTCRAQTLASWLSAALQASDDDAAQRRQDTARQNQKVGRKHKRRRLVQRPDPAASTGPSSAITDEAAIGNLADAGRRNLADARPAAQLASRNGTERARALSIRHPGLPHCLAHCQILKVIRGLAL